MMKKQNVCVINIIQKYYLLPIEKNISNSKIKLSNRKLPLLRKYKEVNKRNR